jgi:hypothetical protein
MTALLTEGLFSLPITRSPSQSRFHVPVGDLVVAVELISNTKVSQRGRPKLLKRTVSHPGRRLLILLRIDRHPRHKNDVCDVGG